MDSAKADLIVSKYNHRCNNNLVESVKCIVKYCEILSSYAPQHDFRDVKANGFRSMVKLADKFLDLLVSVQETSSISDKDVDLFERMAETIVVMLKFSNCVRENMTPDHGSPVNFCTQAKVNIETIRSVEKYKHLLSVSFDKYANFQYSGTLQKALRMYMNVASFIWNGLFSMRGMFNFITNHYSSTAETFFEFGLSSDYRCFSKVLNIFTNTYYTGALSLVMNGMNKLSIDDNLYLAVDSKYKIHADGQLSESLPPVSRAKAIRCRYFLNRFDEKNETLVLHMHGSAFLAMSPESFQALNRGWSEKLENMPILSINYSLAPESKFPVALQELLDIYLHLMSGGEAVSEQLRFTPKQIVVTGDSAGANMLLALMCVINDLNKQFKSEIALPKAAVLIYPTVAVSFSLTPSRLFTINDVVLPTYLVMEVIRSYVDLSEEFDEDNLSQADEKAKWFLRDYPEKVFHKIQRKLEKAYISPLFYGDFESLQSVDLYLVTSEYDTFQDDSISLAHKWKGKVVLDVVPDLPHGFLHFMGTSSEINAAYELCGERLCQAAGKC